MTSLSAFLAALCSNLAYPSAETSNMENRNGRKKIISWWLTGKKVRSTEVERS